MLKIQPISHANRWKICSSAWAKGQQACSSCIAIDQEALNQQLQMAMASVGQGAIKRGPGAAPLFFSKEDPGRIDIGNSEGISNGDLSRALPGETVQTKTYSGELDVDEYQGSIQDYGYGENAKGGIYRMEKPSDTRRKSCCKRFF